MGVLKTPPTKCSSDTAVSQNHTSQNNLPTSVAALQLEVRHWAWELPAPYSLGMRAGLSQPYHSLITALSAHCQCCWTSAHSDSSRNSQLFSEATHKLNLSTSDKPLPQAQLIRGMWDSHPSKKCCPRVDRDAVVGASNTLPQQQGSSNYGPYHDGKVSEQSR